MRVSLRPRGGAADQSEAYDGDKRDCCNLAWLKAMIVERLVFIAVVARHRHSAEQKTQTEHQLDPFTRVAPGIQKVNKKSTGKCGQQRDLGCHNAESLKPAFQVTGLDGQWQHNTVADNDKCQREFPIISFDNIVEIEFLLVVVL